MKQFKKRQPVLPIVVCEIMIFTFIALSIFGSYYFLQNYQEIKLNEIDKVESRLDTTANNSLIFIGLENVKFANETLIKDEITSFLKEKYKEATTVAILNKARSETDNYYVFYFQIDDHNTIFKGVYNKENKKCDFTINDDDISNIESIGGVDKNSKDSVRDVYINESINDLKISNFDEKEKLLGDNKSIIKDYLYKYFELRKEQDKLSLDDTISFISEEKQDNYIKLNFNISSKNNLNSNDFSLFYDKRNSLIYLME